MIPENTTKKVKAHVSDSKKKRVAELERYIKENKTILIASIKNIPGNQFQEIVKKLRGKAKVSVPKKNLIFRAIDGSSKEQEEIEKLKENIHEDIAVLFSNLDAFELASELAKSKRPAKAKPGQIAKEDIEVAKGPTDLMPGPAISELGDLGIPVKIEKGKIHIQKSKVIVKSGQEVSKEASDVMNKLNIKPFMIGFVPICAFDKETQTLYTEMKIDTEEAIEELKKAHSRALPFAVEIGYITGETLTFVIGKAASHGKALENLLEKCLDEKKDEPEKKVEDKAAESKEEDEKKTEESAQEKSKEESKPKEKAEEEKKNE